MGMKRQKVFPKANLTGIRKMSQARAQIVACTKILRARGQDDIADRLLLVVNNLLIRSTSTTKDGKVQDHHVDEVFKWSRDRKKNLTKEKYTELADRIGIPSHAVPVILEGAYGLPSYLKDMAYNSLEEGDEV